MGICGGASFRATSKRTRIETKRLRFYLLLTITFRATSKRTRIETVARFTNIMTTAIFQSNIQENKDWNLMSFFRSQICILPFRATSKRTRIETRIWGPGNRTRHNFQSNIQENKDWNSAGYTGALSPRAFRATSKRTRIETGKILEQFFNSLYTFRATSKRTRIETRIWGPGNRTRHNFQSNIQENKDWNNTFLEINTSSPLLLSEQHPREPIKSTIWLINSSLFSGSMRASGAPCQFIWFLPEIYQVC